MTSARATLRSASIGWSGRPANVSSRSAAITAIGHRGTCDGAVNDSSCGIGSDRSRPLPVGFDVLHYWFESAFHKEGLDVADASRDSIRSEPGRPWMRSASRAESHALIHSSFLLERSVRLEEGRAAGMPVDERLLGGLVDLLRRGATV